MSIQVTFSQSETFDVALSADDFSVDFSDMHRAGDYSGSYEVTPSAVTQTLQTTDKILSQNIVVNPIPSNYGLIAWNGSVLTVS